MKMSYLMESKSEAKRLLMKSDENSTREQLLQTGLKPGLLAVDAGGGAGFVTKIISEIVGDAGQCSLIDQSADRLQAAREYNSGRSNIQFIESDLEKINLESNSQDYVFCRFVFEYLAKPAAVLDELIRIAKPNAKIVVGDLDHNILNHYPLDEKLEGQLYEGAKKLTESGRWDPYAGRKIYSLFSEAGLSNIQVHFVAHHLIYGEAAERDIQNWEMKLDQLVQLQKTAQIELSFDAKEFKDSFMQFFLQPQRFSYTPLILVEAEKPLSS